MIVFDIVFQKMSHLHFVATEEYKKRIVQMGENPRNVYNVGGLGTEFIDKIKLLSKKNWNCQLTLN